jgi:hypothetical protein
MYKLFIPKPDSELYGKPVATKFIVLLAI